MGILDAVLKKEKTPHNCYRCGKEFTGMFAGTKLRDGVYICSECEPKATKLMGEKGALQESFKDIRYSMDSTQMTKYIEYREKNKKRADEFIEEEEYLDGLFLIDRTHMWFKVKHYEEIFPIQQISTMIVTIERDGKAYIVKFHLLLEKNWVYSKVLITYRYKAKGLFEEIRDEMCIRMVQTFHDEVRPQAGLIMQ